MIIFILTLFVMVECFWPIFSFKTTNQLGQWFCLIRPSTCNTVEVFKTMLTTNNHRHIAVYRDLRRSLISCIHISRLSLFFVYLCVPSYYYLFIGLTDSSCLWVASSLLILGVHVLPFVVHVLYMYAFISHAICILIRDSHSFSCLLVSFSLVWTSRRMPPQIHFGCS